MNYHKFNKIIKISYYGLNFKKLLTNNQTIIDFTK
jgi:hypothetical protein